MWKSYAATSFILSTDLQMRTKAFIDQSTASINLNQIPTCKIVLKTRTQMGGFVVMVKE